VSIHAAFIAVTGFAASVSASIHPAAIIIDATATYSSGRLQRCH
jgi:hypothetical protein